MQTKHIQYERLVRAFHADIYRYAVWLIKDPSIAEDVVQETFLRAWKSLDALQDEKAVKAWYLAAAASIMLAVTVFMVNTQSNELNLYQDALAHIEHAADHELADAGKVTLADINTKLASLQGVLDASIGTILSVNFCSLDGVRSLHVMVGNKDNPTSLFILPKDTALEGVPTTQSTSATVDFANAKVLIMGEVAETVQSLKAQIKAHLKFSLHD